MSQNVPANGFKWVENTYRFNRDFIENYNYEGYFLEVDVQYLSKLYDLHNHLPILLEIIIIEKVGEKTPYTHTD